MKHCKPVDKLNYENLLQGYENKKIKYKNRLNNIKSLCGQHAICIKCFERCAENFAKIGKYNDIVANISECNHYICVKCMEDIENKNNGFPPDRINIKCGECEEDHTRDTYKIKTINLSQKYIKSFKKETFDKNYVLEQIINICDDKIIVYCENSNISYHVKNITDKLNIDFEELNGGNRSKIDEILANFKDNSKIRILIIDNAAMTVGMNLEFVNNIIIYSKTNKNTKKQLIGRSNRFPRTDKLYVFNLLYKNEK